MENTFGRLKNRFRVLKAPLMQKGNINNGIHPGSDYQGYIQAARIIRACFILHNVLCRLGDEIDLETNERSVETALNDGVVRHPVPGNTAKARRDAIKMYLSTLKSIKQ